MDTDCRTRGKQEETSPSSQDTVPPEYTDVSDDDRSEAESPTDRLVPEVEPVPLDMRCSPTAPSFGRRISLPTRHDCLKNVWQGSDQHVMRSVKGRKEGRKEVFYLTTHSTHFVYGYMALDIW